MFLLAGAVVVVAESAVASEGDPSADHPLSTLCLVAAAVIAVVHLSVVDWGGEEIARMEVRPSDTVLVGMLQVEEQLGVPPRSQRLVGGERQLGEEDAWSVCGVSDWSTVQLRIIVEVSCNELPSSCVVMKTTQ